MATTSSYLIPGRLYRQKRRFIPWISRDPNVFLDYRIPDNEEGDEDGEDVIIMFVGPSCFLLPNGSLGYFHAGSQVATDPEILLERLPL